jgi:carbon monoxide dehydrogenase subunit G
VQEKPLDAHRAVHREMRLPLTFVEKLSAPRAIVFSEVTDFEHLRQKFPNVFISIRVVKRSKNMAVTEERFSAFGMVIGQRSRHTMRDSTTHLVEILTGDLAGSRVAERYSDAEDGGTIVNVRADLSVRGLASFLPPFVVRPMVEASLRRVFGELEAKFSVESPPS